MSSHDVIVIGGGAAGLMAAGVAAEQGRRVLLIEKMEQPARKLRITGKGRCNLTNMRPVPEFIEHFGRDGRFLRQAFARFFSGELIEFFEGLGVPVVHERGERVFPKSGKAPDVARALVGWVKSSGVEVVTRESVTQLVVNEGHMVGVRTNREKLRSADQVILTTGGSSYPLTGSSGEGYDLARAVGHKIVPLRPALVPLESRSVPQDALADLNLRNVSARVLVNGKKKAEQFGELTFTATGVSGPMVLTVSSLAVDALGAGQTVELVLDLKPALDDQKLDARLLRDIAADSNQDFRTLLNGLLPMKLIPFCLEQTGVPGSRKLHELKGAERQALRRWLKECRFTIDGHRPMAEAIVTAGGVALKEVDPRTMESKVVKGLFLAGEVLDLAGDTGGYNLQAAFSTGWLAGMAVVEG